MSSKKYYLGLDIGTNSVGFAVTDENYNLVRKFSSSYNASKHLWGARLFEEAKNAEERRNYRNSRRRLQRRRYRILLLREIFDKEINKIDDTFFKRLDYSFYKKKELDKVNLPNNFLLKDEKLTNEYLKKYPTIFHLRKALCDVDEKFDIRLVYLAISHIIKYRGNFLTEGSLDNKNFSSDDIVYLTKLFNTLDDLYREYEKSMYEEDSLNMFNGFNINDEKAEQLLKLFSDESCSTSILLDKEKNIFNDLKSRETVLLRGINGGQQELNKIFPRLVDDNEELGKEKINLTKEDCSNKIDSYSYDLIDIENEILVILKEIYSFRILKKILKGGNSISESMISIYNEHHCQLKNLKHLIKTYSNNNYNEIFKADIRNEKAEISYSSYIGRGTINGKFDKVKSKKANIDELTKKLKKILDPLRTSMAKEDLIIYDELCKNIENNTFLRTQNNRESGVIPYQIHEIELKEIIKNQGKYYPFLLEKDKSFPDPEVNDYKILSLLRFKIPYYIGPLSNGKNNEHKEFDNHWAVRKERGKITPWNFYDIIDKNSSAEEFMNKLKNTCSYIYGEQTMPKESLYFQIFKVLNDLNCIKINDHNITYD